MMIPTMDYEKIFSPFTDPKGKKNINYPIKDIYALYIGNKEETIEIAICQKITDKDGNTIYIDLITNNEYNPNHKEEIYPTKFYTLTSLLTEKTKTRIQSNGYITSFDLIDLYNELNKDIEYETRSWRCDNVEYNAPIFAKTYMRIIPVLTEQETELTQLIANIKTNKNPTIIYGDKGIGKTILVDKLLYYAHHDSTYIDIEKIFMMNYVEMLNKTRTIKHEKNRIKKALEFLKNIKSNLLIIDNVDMTNHFFINTLSTLAKEENIQLVLVASNKKDINLQDNRFSYIEVEEPNDKTKKEIFKLYLDQIEKEKKYKIDFSQEDILDILIDADKINSINQTEITRNPKLGMQIINNAFIIASSKNIKRKKDKVIAKEDFIQALDQDNIKMDNKTKENIKERFKNLEEKKQQKTFLKYLKRVN